MSRNLLIILLSLAAAVGSITGAGMFVEPLNTQRRELQLTYNADVVENMPPGVAVLYAGLGSFRGLLINALWMRANALKEAGQFYEAMELSELITTIQPRFAEVWSFHSWNMAYNISVATHTPRERWMWVNRGIELLRERGIPNNPHQTALYRQLGWTFLHKVGQTTDDMHWHYKQQLAWRWHVLLGEPEEGRVVRREADGSIVRDESGNPIEEPASVAGFRPIGRMDRAYFADDMLPAEVRRRLARFSEEFPSYAPALNRMSHLDPAAFIRRAEAFADEVEPRYTGLIEALGEMADAARRLVERGAVNDPVGAFLEDHPEAARTVDLLRGYGLELDRELLERLGRVELFLEGEEIGHELPASPDPEERAAHDLLRDWLAGAEPMRWLDGRSEVVRRMERGRGVTDAEVRAEVERVRDDLVLPFVRARVLRESFHMKPAFMLELMSGDWLATAEHPVPHPLPLDWRHPGAHALYWSALGIRAGYPRSSGDDDYYHTLNTDRQIIHALQQLTRNGRIVFDPFRDYYDQMPDPRFIEGYMRAVTGAEARIAGKFATDASRAPESFQAGRENFLIDAVRMCYFWGARDQAEEYYARLGRTYGPRDPKKFDRYSQPLEQFVLEDFKEEVTSIDEARKTITGLIYDALVNGYAAGRLEIAAQRLSTARKVYRYYAGEQSGSTPNVQRYRMALQPFGRMVANVLEQTMTQPPNAAGGLPMGIKERIWRSIPDRDPSGEPNELKQRVWDRIRPDLYDQVRRFAPRGPSASVRFPEPPGMEAYREAHPAAPTPDDPLADPGT